MDSTRNDSNICSLKKSCVMVRVSGNDKPSANRIFSYKVNGKTIFSCSGFIIDLERGIIITSSVIFLPFLFNNSTSSTSIHSESLSNIVTPQSIEKIINEIKIEILLNCNTNVTLESIDPQLGNVASEHQRIYDPLNNWKQCRFLNFMSCNDNTMLLLNKLKNNFTLVNSNVLNATLDLSFGFVVLQLIKDREAENFEKQLLLDQVTVGNSLEENSGSPITVVGSPFGFVSPTMFLNSISTGVICNKISPPKQYSSPSIYLVDARCLPGNEGSAVFNQQNQLIGIIAPSIKSKNEKLPFTLTPVIPIHCLIAQLERVNVQPKYCLYNNLQYFNDSLSKVQNSIVLVQFKTSWGSGVLISDNGYLLTNAHLIIPSIPQILELTSSSVPPKSFPKRFYKDLLVDIRVSNSAFQGRENLKGYKWLKGSIEYISHTHLDIALIKIKDYESIIENTSSLDQDYQSIDNNNNNSYNNSNSKNSSSGTHIKFHHVECKPLLNPQHGTKIAVLGYPLIPPTHNPPLSITRGIVSNIVSVDGMSVSYQTTASVHSGNSGGGLFDMSGNFLGIVTCNAKQKNGSIITDLNFSIPSTSLLNFFNFANGQDPLALESMKNTTTNKFLKALWKLQISPSILETASHNPLQSKL
ncbi:hypothetical protein DLAC_03266 [Tieghemostelium lacteum]|uniref:Peroxisomal leader peptide-processing protease n=1 Tax=Tieghemostelium lacteum TaxID=361077 RepID=A0A152A1X1_TIELA|nr:hypothetical protein DLAC_03266 [Tieghemostelium lacteum]|eukprot:KYR00117.1 hypothetical protein DLAC_03266 [Tieghemostelium lacteum]